MVLLFATASATSGGLFGSATTVGYTGMREWLGSWCIIEPEAWLDYKD